MFIRGRTLARIANRFDLHLQFRDGPEPISFLKKERDKSQFGAGRIHFHSQ